MKYENVRLVFKGLVGLLVDHSQTTDPENLRVFVSVTHGSNVCHKSRSSQPVQLSRTTDSAAAQTSSQVRRYAAIWDKNDNGIVLRVKPDQVVCLQVCIEFASSGSTLALGYCTWRPAKKGHLDLIAKHYLQEGAAISIDQKRNAMLRFYAAAEGEGEASVTDVSSAVRRIASQQHATIGGAFSVERYRVQRAIIPPSAKDTLRSSRKTKWGKIIKQEDTFDGSKSTLLEDQSSLRRLGKENVRQRLDSESSACTVERKNSSTNVKTESLRQDDPAWETFDEDQLEWYHFDSHELFIGQQLKRRLNLDPTGSVRTIGCNQDETMKLPRRPCGQVCHGPLSPYQLASPPSLHLPPRPPSKPVNGKNKCWC